MSKFSLFLIAAILMTVGAITALLLARPAAAQPDIGIGPGGLTERVAGGGGYEVAISKETAFSLAVGRVIKAALGLVGLVFLVLTIYAGFLWMTAGGNEEQVEKAQKIFKNSTLGLIIALGAYGLTVFILATVGVASNVPQTQVGGAGPGSQGFWSSFGKSFKQNWWRLLF